MEPTLDFLNKAIERPGKTRTGLARALGVHNSAITDLLNGRREIKLRELPKIVKYLDLQAVPIVGMIGAGAIIEPEFEQVPPEGLASVEIPFPVPDEMVAFEVRGDSMVPRYDEGDVIVVWKDQKRAVENYFGKEVAVRTSDGKRFLKTLQRGKGRLVTLVSFNASKAIENVKVAWVGEIYAVLRAGQVVRMRNALTGKNR